MSNQSVNQYNLANLRNQQQLNFAQNVTPAMQGTEGSEVIQQAGGGTYVNRAKASQDADPLTTLGLTAGIGYGIGQAMDYFGPKCEGEYEKTILGKLGAAGDKFAKETNVGRFIESTFQKFENFMARWANKSKIGYSLKNHSTQPEWQFAKMPFYGLPGYWSMDARNIIEQDLKPISAKPTKLFMFLPWKKVNDFNRLTEHGMTKDEVKAFEQSLKGKTFEEKALALQEKQLEKMGFTPAQYQGKSLTEMQDMAKNWKVTKRYGCADFAQLEHRLNHIIEEKESFLKMLKDATKNGDVEININKYDNSWWGKIKSHFAGRRVTLSEYYNKGTAAFGKGNATRIGRALPKSLGWFLEGTTNRFSGGKLAPFIQATIFADMVYHTIKAPKGEHGKTFIERFVNDFMYFVGGTLGVLGIHKFGGFKYLGTNNAGRDAYRAALKDHNILRKAGAFATKKEAKEALKDVNKLLGTENLNFFQKILQKAALLVNCGNEHAVAYRSNSKYNLNFLRKMANSNLVGVPLRIWLAMFVATPFLVKGATKAVHAIFGRPTHSVLDEEEETEEAQDPSQQTNPQQGVTQADVAGYPDSNLVKQTLNGQYPPHNNQYGQPQQSVPQYRYNSQTKRFDQILPNDPDYVNNQSNAQNAQNLSPNNNPNLQNAQNQNEMNGSSPNNQNQSVNITNNTTVTNQQNGNTQQEPLRTYIPSSAGVQTSGPDTTPADMALAHADQAEKEVQSILARRR